MVSQKLSAYIYITVQSQQPKTYNTQPQIIYWNSQITLITTLSNEGGRERERESNEED